MMRLLTALSIILGLSHSVAAQQLMVSSLYDQHGYLHNPSVVGVAQKSMVGASHRSMWSGIEGSPKTTLLFGSTSVQGGRVGLGGYLYSDVTGPTKRTGLQTAYAYHVPVKKDAFFSVGLEARFQQFSLDKSFLQASLGSDPVLAASENRIKGDAGLGISYTAKNWQLGASVSQLIQTKLDFYSGNLSRSEEARLYRHFYLHGNYVWQVDDATRIIPNLLLVYLPNAPTELQAGMRVEHKELLWWGLSLRARQSWMLSAGVKLQNKFVIGYCFDIYSTPLSVFDKGANAHEIVLRYDFIKRKS